MSARGITLKRILHLQQHQHTGKLIAHKHTSYRGLFVIVAIFGIVVAFVKQAVLADDLTVSAKVSAPVPTQPAKIILRLKRNVVTTPVVPIDGTCQYIEPVTVVELYVDTSLSASTPCSTVGDFSSSVTLTPGDHSISARTVNISGDYGPNSIITVITYIVPSIAPRVATTPPAAAAPLTITSALTYLTYGPAKDAVWQGTISGGTSRYTSLIDWGDGSSSSYKDLVPGNQTFTHHYTTFEPYSMVMTVTDSSGHSLSKQFAVVTPYVEPVSQSTQIDASDPFTQSNIITYVMFVTIAMLVLLGTLVVIHSTPLVPLRVARVPVRNRSRGRKS